MKTVTASIAMTILGGALVLTGYCYAEELKKQDTKQSVKLETGAIEKAIGKAGELKDDVYKLSFPRTDLVVTIKEVKVKPGLALGSWVAFKEAGGQAVLDGDLVLTEDEVTPVFQKLRKEGIEVSALHNHLIGESPRVMFLPIAAKGDPHTVAAGIKAALSLTKTPIESPAKPGEASAKPGSEEVGFNAEQIQETLGHKGNVKGGVLQISIPRPENIKMYGATLSVGMGMGMATALNFQAAGDNNIAATGDFVLTRDEVDSVTKALAEHGIAVTALHNHLVHGTPDLYFMHFWVHDRADKVARGLKAGLDAMKKSEKAS